MKAKLTEKEIAALDEKIAALEPKVYEAKRTYDDLIEELAKLIEARYPERQEDAIKDRLYQAYIHSSKDIDFIIDFIENADDEDDYWN